MKFNVIKTMLELSELNHSNRRDAIIQLLNKNSHGKASYIERDSTGLENIILPAKNRVNGKGGKYVVLTAHYDVVPGSKGMNDNLSGVLALIDIMDKVPDNVEIVMTAEEETGYRGASFYARIHNRETLMNINVDIVGISGEIYCTDYSNDTIKLPEDHVLLNNLPFNDSVGFSKAKIPSAIVMTGPKMTKIDRSQYKMPAMYNYHIQDDVDNGKRKCYNSSAFVSAIFEYQHNGRKDNKIEFISVDSIRSAGKFVLETIELNK